MRTRSQSKQPEPKGEKKGKKQKRANVKESIDDNETLSNISRGAVGKLLKRVKRGFDREDVGYLRHCESVAAEPERGLKGDRKNNVDTKGGNDTVDTEFSGGDAIRCASSKEEAEAGVSQHCNPENDDDDNASDWEDGTIPSLSSAKDYGGDLVNGVSIQFDITPSSAKRKPVRRATAEEKEVAEFVHKAHLLCLLGRGRLIDSTCNDPLIQASILSLLPTHLLKIADSPKLTASHLSPLVSWFHNNFRVRSPSASEKSCHLALASTLDSREGTPEMVAALSVALFRALNLTCRFISVLDVICLKPNGDSSEPTGRPVCEGESDVFKSSTVMVAGASCSLVKSSSEVELNHSLTTVKSAGKPKADRLRKCGSQSQNSVIADKSEDKKSDIAVSEPSNDISEPCLPKSEELKRKGDLEFEMQLEMALSATSVGGLTNSVRPNTVDSPSTSSPVTLPFKRMKKNDESQSSSSGVSIAIGSQKVGAPLYWAEVFCGGDNLTGKWVHVDAVNASIDGEHKVEAAAAACKKSLRYVVAFAGRGAKDVTRRYCTKWYKVASQRINSIWWDTVLAPLKELEARATSGAENGTSGAKKIETSQVANSNYKCLMDTNKSRGPIEEGGEKNAVESTVRSSFASARSSLEDMELETRALTEPLPTNQQAYRSHHLYVIERWLKKYEILHPKGPVLGFCSGHAVYPRTCVQILHTKERWLREGLQVKADELPAKVLKRSLKRSIEENVENDEFADGDHEQSTSLYGKWQTQPLCLPRAVNGIVPRNERGQVDVWSEKCLPPGTVHLRFPRLVPVAKRLDVDFAPAMVGFDFRNGRSVPVYEGIVVCAEFKDAILEAYAEEEGRREAEEKRRNEAQALSRWYQLLSSIVTRQRLNNSYGDPASSQISIDAVILDDKSSKSAAATKRNETSPRRQQADPAKEKGSISLSLPTENHEHEFILDEQGSDEEGSTRVKRCHCGFSVQYEEL